MIYFSSDLHFGHNKDFIYGPREFNSIEEHDAAIIDNINSTVGCDDELILLGDLAFGEEEKMRENLMKINCRNIKYVIGNHDSNKKQGLYKECGIQCLGYAHLYTYKKLKFYLSHYPTATANYDDGMPFERRGHNLCGHIHTKELLDPITKSYHVELDAHENKPISIDKIIADLKNIPVI